MDLETAVKLGQLGFMVAQAIVLLIMFLMRSSFASKKELAEARQRADSAHHRQDLLDERLKGFPGYDVTNELRDDFADMGRAQAEVATELRLVREQLQRMDDFLRNHR
jgi:hypothetical protein